MKRLVILFALVIALMSFASAASQGHPICNPAPINQSLNGVYINGECYDCGEDDLVCPENYGAVCTIPDPDCEPTLSVYWSSDYSGNSPISSVAVNLTGKKIHLVLRNSELPNGNAVFKLYEPRAILDYKFKEINANVSNGNAVANWTITLSELEAIDYENKKIYFKVEGVSQSSGDLNITTTSTTQAITQCSNYTDNVSCIADSGNVGGLGVVTPRVNGSCYYDRVGKCAWNGSVCQQTTNETARTGNPLDCSAARGSCVYGGSQQTGDCSIDDFFTISYTSTDSIRCPPYTTGFIPCPQQVNLSFFSLFNLIASISIISIIYAFLLRKFD